MLYVRSCPRILIEHVPAGAPRREGRGGAVGGPTCVILKRGGASLSLLSMGRGYVKWLTGHELVEEEEAEVVLAALEAHAVGDPLVEVPHSGGPRRLLRTFVAHVVELGEERVVVGLQARAVDPRIELVLELGPRGVLEQHRARAVRERAQVLLPVRELVVEVGAHVALQERELLFDGQAARGRHEGELRDVLQGLVLQVPRARDVRRRGHERDLEAARVRVGRHVAADHAQLRERARLLWRERGVAHAAVGELEDLVVLQVEEA